jgi:addiction module RelE/StbE family toxin
MWRVLESKAAQKVLDKAPHNVRDHWIVWLTTVEQTGPKGLLAIRGFKDEALSGEWRGYRSSRLTLQARVIYRVHGEVLEVHVVRVTLGHDYRKK